MEYQVYQTEGLRDEEIRQLTGIGDENLKALEKIYGVDINYRDDRFMFFSMDEKAFALFSSQISLLLRYIQSGQEIHRDTIAQSYQSVVEGKEELFLNWNKKVIAYTFGGRPIRPKTLHQHELLEAISNHDMTLAIGPAGTGKTFLAVTMAVNAYKSGKVKKIVLTRPAVEAGESLGFLPGDLKEKVDPYLMPLYDALDDLLGSEQFTKLLERGVIEIIPLAYMRGRTLNDAFVILDEAQNTTDRQMLMFLTRLGMRSKMVINGDITQIDLKIPKESSGLIVAWNKLQGIDEIALLKLDRSDVVRSPLVQKIIDAYDR